MIQDYTIHRPVAPNNKKSYTFYLLYSKIYSKFLRREVNQSSTKFIPMISWNIKSEEKGYQLRVLRTFILYRSKQCECKEFGHRKQQSFRYIFSKSFISFLANSTRNSDKIRNEWKPIFYFRQHNYNPDVKTRFQRKFVMEIVYVIAYTEFRIQQRNEEEKEIHITKKKKTCILWINK